MVEGALLVLASIGVTLQWLEYRRGKYKGRHSKK